MNDIERAIETINNQKQFIGIDYSKGKDLTAICLSGNLAESTVMALEKQIPKKPVLTNNPVIGKYYQCDCGGILTIRKQRYCKFCGQLQDWSDKP
jgi:phage terminase large subunit-like protein